MNEINRLLTADGLLAKISIVTGWILPGSRDKTDPQNKISAVLTSELAKLLSLKYSDLTFADVEVAFRLHGLQVQDWGKSINLALFDQVLDRYNIDLRAAMNKTEPKELPPPAPPMTDDLREDWLNRTARAVQSGTSGPFFMPLELYEYCVHTKKLQPTPGAKWDALKVATQKQLEFFEARVAGNDKSYEKPLERHRAMMKDGFFGPEKEELIRLSKRVLLYHFLKTYETGQINSSAPQDSNESI